MMSWWTLGWYWACEIETVLKVPVRRKVSSSVRIDWIVGLCVRSLLTHLCAMLTINGCVSWGHSRSIGSGLSKKAKTFFFFKMIRKRKGKKKKKTNVVILGVLAEGVNAGDHVPEDKSKRKDVTSRSDSRRFVESFRSHPSDRSLGSVNGPCLTRVFDLIVCFSVRTKAKR